MRQTRAAFLLGVLAMTAAVSTQSYAQSISLQCTNVFGAHQLCSLAPTEILAKQAFEAELHVSYTFACQGNRTGLVLASEQASVPLVYGGSGATPAVLVGFGPFELRDTAPDVTVRATLVGDCAINITNLDVKPSASQLSAWKDEASLLARILNTEIDEYRLAKSLEAVVAWDDSQLAATEAQVEAQLLAALPSSLPYDSLVYPTPCDKPGKCGQLRDAADMPDAWTLAVISNPQLPDLVALKAQIESVKAGRPAYDPAQTEALRAQLGADVAEASQVIANGDHWVAVIDADTQALVAMLKQLVSKAANT